MSHPTEREAFEKFFPRAAEHRFKTEHEDEYDAPYDSLWEGWQSRGESDGAPTVQAEPTITEHELAFALNYHSDDTRINDADWKIAGRYFDVILANRGTHPSLGGPDSRATTGAKPD